MIKWNDVRPNFLNLSYRHCTEMIPVERTNVVILLHQNHSRHFLMIRPRTTLVFYQNASHTWRIIGLLSVAIIIVVIPLATFPRHHHSTFTFTAIIISFTHHSTFTFTAVIISFPHHSAFSLTVTFITVIITFTLSFAFAIVFIVYIVSFTTLTFSFAIVGIIIIIVVRSLATSSKDISFSFPIATKVPLSALPLAFTLSIVFIIVIILCL